LSPFKRDATAQPNQPNVIGELIPLEGRAGGALREELLSFIRCLREGKDADPVPPTEVRHGLAVTLALIQSATEDRDVTLSDVTGG